MVPAPLSKFGSPTICEDPALRLIKQQQQIDLQNLCDEVHTPSLTFNTEQRKVFNEIVCAILPGVAYPTL